jgi:tetratricopeptide (TPR) repeat protein
MKMLKRVLARGRILNARRRLAACSSPRNYIELAQEYARLGLTREVRSTCEEGLGLHPGNSELSRLRERARRLEREERMLELKRELADAPRAALWREMCEIQIESGRLARAEEVASEWLRKDYEPEAKVMMSRVLFERYVSDRGRAQGKRAHDCLQEAIAACPEDARPRRLLLDLLVRLGAWKEAREACEDLLKLAPGDPILEARYRSIEAQLENARSIDRALIEIERTGRFADEPELRLAEDEGGDIRPLLRDLAADPEVHAALYVRGSTVLVHGPRGATAERTARAVHSILSGSRAVGRRIGLGHVRQVQLEGEFGALAIAPGQLDAAALWCAGMLARTRERELRNLVGRNAPTREVQS